jgi:hypothetical protein
MTLKNSIIVAIIIFVSGLGTGGYSVYRYYNKPIPNPNPPIVKPVISKPVDRPNTITCDEEKNLLWHYDNDKVNLNWTLMEQTKTEMNINLTGNLFEREFYQDITFKIVDPLRHHGISANYYAFFVNNKLLQAGGIDYHYRWENFSFDPGIIVGKEIFGAKAGATYYFN